MDKPFDKGVWMARLGQTIGAVLSITQFAMVLFADAYVPYWLRSRVIQKELRARRKRATRATLPRATLPAADLELQEVAEDNGLSFATSTRPSKRAGGEITGGCSSGLGRPENGDHRAVREVSWKVGERMGDMLHEATMSPYDPMLDYAGNVPFAHPRP